jgi:hypothetical protein
LHVHHEVVEIAVAVADHVLERDAAGDAVGVVRSEVGARLAAARVIRGVIGVVLVEGRIGEDDLALLAAQLVPVRVEDLAVAVWLRVEGERPVERALLARAVNVRAVGDQEEADVPGIDVRLRYVNGRGRAGGDAGLRTVVIRVDEDDSGFAGAAVVPAEGVFVAGTLGNKRDLQHGHLAPPGISYSPSGILCPRTAHSHPQIV